MVEAGEEAGRLVKRQLQLSGERRLWLGLGQEGWPGGRWSGLGYVLQTGLVLFCSRAQLSFNNW